MYVTALLIVSEEMFATLPRLLPEEVEAMRKAIKKLKVATLIETQP